MGIEFKKLADRFDKVKAEAMPIANKVVHPEIRGKLEKIGNRSVKKASEAIVEEVNDKIFEAVEILSDMIPSALSCVYDILNKEEVTSGDKIKLNASQMVLGVFGISEKKKLEVTRKSGIEDKGNLMKELKDEFRRQAEVINTGAAETILIGNEEGEVSSKFN